MMKSEVLFFGATSGSVLLRCNLRRFRIDSISVRKVLLDHQDNKRRYKAVLVLYDIMSLFI